VKTKLVAGTSALVLVGSLAVAAAPGAGAAAVKINTQGDSVTCNDILGKIKFAVPLHLSGTAANQITVSIKSLDCTDNNLGVFDPDVNPGGLSLKSVSQKGILTSSNNDCLGLSGLSTSTSGQIIGSWATNAGTPGLDTISKKSTIGVTQTFGGTFNATAGVIPAAWSNATTYTTGQNVSFGGYSYTATGNDGPNLNKQPSTHDGAAPNDQWTINAPVNDLNSWGASYGLFQIGTTAGTSAPTLAGGFANGANGGPDSALIFNGTTGESKGTLANECFSATGIKGITFGDGGFTT